MLKNQVCNLNTNWKKMITDYLDANPNIDIEYKNQTKNTNSPEIKNCKHFIEGENVARSFVSSVTIIIIGSELKVS